MTFWLREFRTPALRLLLLTLALAVASVTAVGLFSQRLDRAFERDAAALIGGDIALVSDREIDSTLRDLAVQAGLSASVVRSFPSMALHDERSLLVSLKVVDSAYPLRGQLKTATDRLGPPEPTAGAGLGDNEAWVDESLLAGLSAMPGSLIQLGDSQFRITRVIFQEPDRPMAFANFAPRVMINPAGLEKTGLIQPGSRVSWKLLVTGSDGQRPALDRVRSVFTERLQTGQRLDDVRTGRPEIRNTLERATQFLTLSALLATVVASVGLALAARHYGAQQRGKVALLKSMGQTPSRLRALWLGGLLLMAAAGSLTGAGAGWLAHLTLVELLDALVATRLPPPGWQPWAQAGLMGLLLTLGFAAPPLVSALQVPPVAVLRPAPESGRKWLVISIVAGVLTLGLACTLAAGSLKQGFLMLAAVLVVTALFVGLAWAVIRSGLALFAKMGRGSQSAPAFRFAWLSLSRRIGSTLVQGVALTLGLTALMLLTVLRGDLIDSWQAAVPADAPNRFALNIQPAQQEAVTAELEKASGKRPVLYPMVRGRLVAINGEPTGPDNYTDDRAKRLLDREFNLSWSDTLPDNNTLVQGQWFTPDAAELSIEEGLMKTLKLKPGDILQFDIAGSPVEARIGNVRAVKWDSMQANFFILFPSRILRDQPHSWMTAFHLPTGRENLARVLLDRYPNLTLVDTELIMQQVRGTLGKISRAVEFIFLFTVAAGALVLVASLMANQQQRLREAALLRAMGASRSQIRSAILLELLLVGLLGGLMAGIAAQAIGVAVAHFAFEFAYTPSIAHLLLSVGVAVGVALSGGLWSIRRIIATPPTQVLRTA